MPHPTHFGGGGLGLEQIRPSQLQIHQPGIRNSFLSPLSDRRLCNVEHASNRSGAAQLVDLFGIGMFLAHAAILAIANE